MKLWIKLTNGPSSIAADADWIRTAASVLSDVSVFRVGLPRSNVWVASCGPLAKRSKVDGERNPRPTLSTSATGSDTWYSMPKLPVTELQWRLAAGNFGDRKSTRLNSSHANISYAVFCLKKKS